MTTASQPHSLTASQPHSLTASQPHSLTASQHRYHVLDGLRGIAALIIMVFHYTSHNEWWLFRNAPISVDLFFMLSGFVLAQSYSAQIEARVLDFKGFMVKRVIRLYPMYILGLSLGFVSMFFLTRYDYTDFTNHQLAVSFVYNSLFLPYFNMNSFHHFEREFASVGSIFPLNGVSWSLFFEMFISLFFIAIVLTSTANLKKLVYVAAALFLANGFLMSWEGYNYGFNADTGWSTLSFSGGFTRVLFSFTAGILIQRIILLPRTQAYLGKLSLLSKNAILLYALTVLMLSIPYTFKGVTHVASILLFCPLIVLLGAYCEIKNKTLIEVSKFLGWISYPVYCLHVPVGNILALSANEGFGYKLTVTEFVVFACLLTLTAAIIFTRFYEEPVRKFLSQQYAKFVKRQIKQIAA